MSGTAREGAHRSVANLEQAIRDVDLDDQRAYMIHGDVREVIEWRRAQLDVLYDRDEQTAGGA